MKEYLGDGVYVAAEHGMVKLTAEDGMSATDTIYLEQEVLAAFLEWLKLNAPNSRSARDEPNPT